MIERHEFWRVVASGGLKTLLDGLIAQTDKDARRLGIDGGYFTGKLWIDAYAALGYTPGSESIMRCWDYVDDRYYNPRFSDDAVPFVTAPALDGTTLVAGEQPAGHTVQVYSWNFTIFELKGPLGANSQPGDGHYVLVLTNDSTGGIGLPSQFFEIAS